MSNHAVLKKKSTNFYYSCSILEIVTLLQCHLTVKTRYPELFLSFISWFLQTQNQSIFCLLTVMDQFWVLTQHFYRKAPSCCSGWVISHIMHLNNLNATLTVVLHWKGFLWSSMSIAEQTSWRETWLLCLVFQHRIGFRGGSSGDEPSPSAPLCHPCGPRAPRHTSVSSALPKFRISERFPSKNSICISRARNGKLC